MATAIADVPLDLVVRFSTSAPDITLHIPSPKTTTAVALKQRIRANLAEPAASSRLRLIHAGKVVEDAAALSKSLHILRAPSGDQNGDEKHQSAKAKGKRPVQDLQIAPTARVYIHCSVGDVLQPAELAAEAKAAQDADAALLSKAQTSLGSLSISTSAQDERTTTPAPRGFDRLLSAGFTASEVAALRTQFLAIQAHTHTPDTMPSGAELLALEEQWLDNTSNPAAAGGEDGGGFGGDDSRALEDMLYGNLIGFFWPVGAMFWLTREEGIWSRRRQISVLSGFLVNLTFGFLKILN